MWKKIASRKKWIAGILILVLLAGIIFSGREEKKNTVRYKKASDVASQEVACLEMASDEAETAQITPEYAENKGTQDILSSNQKIIQNWTMTIQTQDYESSIQKVEKLVNNSGGYVESQKEYGCLEDLQQAYYTLRIPEKEGDSIIEKLQKIGTVISKTKSSENVTLQYIDTEGRLKSLRTEKETLEDLLKTVKSWSDVISIQDEIQEINYQIESYESQIRYLQNSVEYMTIDLEIQEVTREEIQSPDMFEEIQQRFLNTTQTMKTLLRNLIVSLAGNSIYILVFLAFLIVFRKIRKKKKGKYDHVE